MEKVSFEDLKALFEEHETNKPKIKRFFWQARTIWKDDITPAVKQLREDPKAKVSPYQDICWFLTYRKNAKDLQKRNKQIESKINKIIKAFNTKPKKTK